MSEAADTPTPRPTLPPFVLADGPTLALLYRVQVVGDLPSESYDDAWDGLPEPEGYTPTEEVQDWLRANWETLIPPANGSPLVPVDPKDTPPRALTRSWMPLFLEEIAEGATASEAAKTAGILRRQAYRLQERDPEFAARWEAAKAQAADLVRAEVRRRAIEGWQEPIIGSIGDYKDGQLHDREGRPLFIRKFDSTLLARMAGAYCAEFKREAPSTSVNVNASASSSASAVATVENTPEQLQRLQERKRRRMERAAGIIVPLVPPVDHTDGNN